MWRATFFGRRTAAVALIAFASGCSSSRSAITAPVEIDIEHRVGTAPLRLGGTGYRTPAGDEFTVDHLRYYLSNFRLRSADGRWFANPQSPQSSQGYFLVDAAAKETQTLRIGPLPQGDYSGIEFLIGVDPERNHAGAQAGDLDPARGMFWTWATGYIFFKLEGHSPQSLAEQHQLLYHLGASDKVSDARRVFLTLQPEPIHVSAGTPAKIHLIADVSQAFDGAHSIRITELSEAMSPATSAPIADNVAGLFSVDHSHGIAAADHALSP